MLTFAELMDAVRPYDERRHPRAEDVAGLRRRYLEIVLDAQSSRPTLQGIWAGAPLLRDVHHPLRAHASMPGTTQPAIDLLLDAVRVRRNAVAIGPVGAGKSELLHLVAARLAKDALSSAEAPLPIVLNARAASGGLLDAIADGSLPRDLVASLVGVASWVVIIDGLDEVPDQDWMAWARRLLGTRLSSVVVSTRTARTVPVDAVIVRLAEWRRDDVEAVALVGARRVGRACSPPGRIRCSGHR